MLQSVNAKQSWLKLRDKFSNTTLTFFLLFTIFLFGRCNFHSTTQSHCPASWSTPSPFVNQNRNPTSDKIACLGILRYISIFISLVVSYLRREDPQTPSVPLWVCLPLLPCGLHGVSGAIKEKILETQDVKTSVCASTEMFPA